MAGKTGFDLGEFVEGQLARDASLRHDFARLSSSQSVELRAELAEIPRTQDLEALAASVNGVLERYDPSGLRLVFSDQTTGTLPKPEAYKHVVIYTSEDLEGEIVTNDHQHATLVAPNGIAHLYTMGRGRRAYEPILRVIRTIVNDGLRYRQVIKERDQALDTAHKDKLTGLPNRQYLEQVVLPHIDRIIRDALRKGEIPSLALAKGDLDEFKRFNNVSYATGDQVIKLTARALADSLSTARGDTVVRLGGEEFNLYLPLERDNLFSVVDRVRNNVEKYTRSAVDQKVLPEPSTMSMGAVHISDLAFELRLLYTPEGRLYLSQVLTAGPEKRADLQRNYQGNPNEFNRIVDLTEYVVCAYNALDIDSELKKRYSSPEEFLHSNQPKDLVPTRILDYVMRAAADAGERQAKKEGKNRLVIHQR